ncbi:Alpha/Beta hydrolase protein [Mycena filopes]|nr:Alpha/Beta hydrolase protein [Mycena filopes]
MSNLLRSTMSARLAKLPPDLPPHPSDLLSIPAQLQEEEEDDEFLDAENGDALGSLGHGGYSGLGPPAMPFLTPRPRTKKPPNADFAPISAEGYFADALQVLVPERALDCRVYYTPPGGVDTGGGGKDATVLVCHHGGGYSALSFAVLAREVRAQGRGCGKTKSTSPGEEDPDLSIAVLVADFVATLRAVFPDPAVAPTLLLVGHSMGGSVVTRACPLLLEARYRVSGVAVLDVVEGSAVEALPHMHALLNARPDGFDSVESAVEWHVKTKTIRSAQSARVSVPSIVVPAPAPAAADGAEPPHAYVWRTPLRSTAGYWQGWFTGLSAAFLDARAARLLLLAGTDRLDKPLMIAQMQGKFQMVVVAGVGHMMHEDDPMHVAELLLEFWRRNDRARIPVRVKGVGEG